MIAFHPPEITTSIFREQSNVNDMLQNTPTGFFGFGSNDVCKHLNMSEPGISRFFAYLQVIP